MRDRGRGVLWSKTTYSSEREEEGVCVSDLLPPVVYVDLS